MKLPNTVAKFKERGILGRKLLLILIWFIYPKQWQYKAVRTDSTLGAGKVEEALFSPRLARVYAADLITFRVRNRKRWKEPLDRENPSFLSHSSVVPPTKGAYPQSLASFLHCWFHWLLDSRSSVPILGCVFDLFFKCYYWHSVFLHPLSFSLYDMIFFFAYLLC